MADVDADGGWLGPAKANTWRLIAIVVNRSLILDMDKRAMIRTMQTKVSGTKYA